MKSRTRAAPNLARSFQSTISEPSLKTPTRAARPVTMSFETPPPKQVRFGVASATPDPKDKGLTPQQKSPPRPYWTRGNLKITQASAKLSQIDRDSAAPDLETLPIAEKIAWLLADDTGS